MGQKRNGHLAMSEAGGDGSMSMAGGLMTRRALAGHPVAGQVLRYAVAGGLVTALQAAVYWLLAQWAGFHPQIANLLGYLVAVASGFVIHGRFTFRGHGGRDRPMARGLRFILASLLSLALNACWVWLCVTRLGLSLWTPVPLMALVTPAFMFLLNRQWVFR